MKKFLFLTLMGFLFLCFFGTPAKALISFPVPNPDEVYIDDSVDGVPPTVDVWDTLHQLPINDRVSNVYVDPTNEHISFSLAANNPAAGETASTDLLEDTSGTLSDRFWVQILPGGFDLVKFWSDGADINLLPPPGDSHYSMLETGDWQLVGSIINTGIGNEQYDFYVWSDPPESVPEPNTMILFGLGLIGLVGVRKRISL